MYYNNDEDLGNFIATVYIGSITITDEFIENDQIKNLFKGRLNGKVSITNGSGTYEVTFSNLQYDDFGVIIIHKQFGPQITRENVTLIVHGKF